MKAKAASEMLIETKHEVVNELGSDNASDADSEKLVIDTNKHKPKTGKTKLQTEKKFSVVTQVIPQLEVSQLKTEDRRTEEEAWLEAVESGDLDQVDTMAAKYPVWGIKVQCSSATFLLEVPSTKLIPHAGVNVSV